MRDRRKNSKKITHYNVGVNNPRYGKPGIKGFLGRKHSSETIQKMKIAQLDNNNPMWKGTKVGYKALHNYIRRRLPKPDRCKECGNDTPQDLSNISGKYLRDLADWEWLCRVCHMKFDGRILNLKQNQVIIK